MSDCVFCRIAAGSIPATIVARSGDAVAFRDLNPQAPTHVLVIPTQHVSSAGGAAAAPDGDRLLGALVRFAVQTAKELGLEERGYRLVINTGPDGGQTVLHLHLHILGGRRMTWPPG